MNFEDELRKHLEGEEFWTVITFKTPYGPRETMDRLAEEIQKLGWKVGFKANWWTSEIPYGLIRIDISQGEREKIVLGRWILSNECKLIRIDNLEFEEGKEEFFKMVDSISATLIHDSTIRTMREQY